ncbi:translocation/assembly module TamB domain-containing protein [Alterisphingorhabdus coralli]|uniref:Translocation/assembly module TamB domain-containing protein n=1 Tax=Alterisphingorhabdus coralli TaxID=3071408 RepID=A0AA97F7C0_9SPHN|nr:translocation/assembly module TamB domain-containing protein [Parasphingorhabdus sp. SCSIO 66989]WOE74587.1 translocation/assembly module TamB domain-containing protein [Parasphingorhabdus sp. SCSIO 66989]
MAEDTPIASEDGAPDEEDFASAVLGEDEAIRKSPWRWPRRIAIALLLVVATLIMLALALDTQPGHRFLVNRIETLELENGLRIRMERIDGSIYDEAIIHDLELLDPEGRFFSVDQTTLNWRPMAWLGNVLDIRALLLKDARLEKVPALRETDSDAPILPGFDIRIDRFEANALTIAKGIAGDERIGDITGNADIRDGLAKLKIDATLRNGDDRILADIDIAPDEDRFDAKLDIGAPADGVIAALAGLDRNLTIALDGAGSYRQWSGKLVAEGNKQPLMDFDLGASSGDYSVVGTLFPGDFVSGTLAELIGSEVAVDWVGRLDDRVLNNALSLRAEAFSAEANGKVDLGENRFDTMQIQARSLARDLTVAGVTASALQLEGTLDGAFSELNAPYTVRAANLAFADYAMAQPLLKGQLLRQDGAWATRFDLQNAGIATNNALLDNLLTGTALSGLVRLADGTLISDNLELRGKNLSADLALNGKMDANDYRLTGDVRAPGFPVQNLAALDIQADIDARFNQGWTVAADIDGQIQSVTNQSFAVYVGETGRFSANVLAAEGQPVIFRDVDFAATQLAFLGGGRLESDGHVVLTAAGNHVRYGGFDVDIDGNTQSASANIFLASPYPALDIRDVTIAVAPSADGFTVNAKGQSVLGGFGGNAGITALDNGLTRINLDQLRLSDTVISGIVTAGDAGLRGDLDASGGGVDGTIKVRPVSGRNSLIADLELRNAAFVGATPIRIRQGSIDATILLGDGPIEVDAVASAQGISRGNLFIGRLAGKAKLSGRTGTITGSIAGRRGSRFAMAGEALVRPNRISFDLTGAYAGKKIDMPKAGTLIRTDAGWRLAETRLNIANGSVEASGRVGRTTQIDFALDRLPLSILDIAFENLGLGGTASGEMNLKFNRRGLPFGTAKLQLNRLTRSSLALTSRPVDLAVNARLSEDKLALRSIIRDADRELGRAQLRLTNISQSDDPIRRYTQANMLGQIRFDGPADALWRLVGIDLFDITGSVAVSADATGTLVNPRVRGRVATRDARLESGLSGTVITDISADGRFSGARLNINRFSGTAPNGGTVTGSGVIDLGGRRGVMLDLKGRAENAELLDREDFGATVTGPISIRSDGVGGTLGGDLVINKGRFVLGQTDVLYQLPNITYREINRRADEAPPRATATPWRYAIKAKARNRIDVRGLGLNSEWRADIALAGPVNQPQITGVAELVRGEYEFAGRDFDLERGIIRFQENYPPDPALDIEANANLQGLSATINVRGTGQRPEITFNSVPALPEDELLARLIFGSSVTDISAAEAVQLAAALASLRGGGGLDPINALRGAVGLDRLRIIAADPAIGAGTSIAAGKYLTRRVYVEVITDGAGYSATQAEFQITRWLSILSSISTIGRQGVSARISRDY